METASLPPSIFPPPGSRDLSADIYIGFFLEIVDHPKGTFAIQPSTEKRTLASCVHLALWSRATEPVPEWIPTESPYEIVEFNESSNTLTIKRFDTSTPPEN